MKKNTILVTFANKSELHTRTGYYYVNNDFDKIQFVEFTDKKERIEINKKIKTLDIPFYSTSLESIHAFLFDKSILDEHFSFILKDVKENIYRDDKSEKDFATITVDIEDNLAKKMEYLSSMYLEDIPVIMTAVIYDMVIQERLKSEEYSNSFAHITDVYTVLMDPEQFFELDSDIMVLNPVKSKDMVLVPRKSEMFEVLTQVESKEAD